MYIEELELLVELPVLTVPLPLTVVLDALPDPLLPVVVEFELLPVEDFAVQVFLFLDLNDCLADAVIIGCCLFCRRTKLMSALNAPFGLLRDVFREECRLAGVPTTVDSIFTGG